MLAAITATFRKLHGEPVANAPRWVVLCAYGASLTVLPSCIWRIALSLGAPIGPIDGDVSDASGPLGTPVLLYAVILSLVSEMFALLTVGLVTRRGEVFPRWIPVLGSRRVPVLAAVVPAALGAVVLIVVTGSQVPEYDTFTSVDGTTRYLDGWRLGLFVAGYGPLLAWGPLLAIVTVAYYLRRTRHEVRRPQATTR